MSVTRGVNTRQLIEVALDVSGMHQLPDDSEIHIPGENIKRVFVGMDVGTGELLLAREMGFDCVVAHHPVGGYARSRSHHVFERHRDFLIKAGVLPERAMEAIEEKRLAFQLAGHSFNHSQIPLIAKALEMPLISLHGPCDEIGRSLMQTAVDQVLDEKSPASLRDVVDALKRYPEFCRSYAEPWIAVGEKDDPAGPTVVAHGALSNGGADIARAYYSAGIGTVIYIHIDVASMLALRKEALGNLIISGHMSSDWLGINPVVNAWETQLGIETYRTSDLWE